MEKIEENILSEERLQEFISIYKSVFGEEISIDEASDKARKLILLFKVILKNGNSIDNDKKIDSLNS